MQLLPLTALLLAVGVSHARVCNHTCSFEGVEDGTKIPNPSDCYSYYVCSDPEGDEEYEPSDAPVPCPDGQYFDPTKTSTAIKGECKSEGSTGPANCDLCNPCAVECPEEAGVLIPDPFDCSGYYVCLQDSIPRGQCPMGKIFDVTNRTCASVKDGAKCYDECDPCEPYCIEEGRIPNPMDCRSYFYCEPPEGLAEFHCTEDEVFDVVSLICVKDEDDEGCTPSCSTQDSTTTEPIETTGTTGTTGTTDTTKASRNTYPPLVNA